MSTRKARGVDGGNGKREKPALRVSRDYGMFEMADINRDLHDDRLLRDSMKRHGFMPSSPIHCIRGANGKLKIVRGHNRFDMAKRLGLQLWYIVDPSNTDIYDLEGATSSRWSIEDFLSSRANSGNKHCQQVLAFRRQHKLPQGVAISLLAGESAGSGNAIRRVKDGTFKIATDLSHAELVADLVDFCRTVGIDCASRSAFVSALSLMARVPEFDPQIFKRRIAKAPSLVIKQTSKKDYMTVIEDVYNYGAKGRRVPLAFKAVEIARVRKETFGRGPKRPEPVAR